MTTYNIYPKNDSSKHKMGEECKCKPDVRYTNDGLSVYVIHNSFAEKKVVEKNVECVSSYK